MDRRSSLLRARSHANPAFCIFHLSILQEDLEVQSYRAYFPFNLRKNADCSFVGPCLQPGIQRLFETGIENVGIDAKKPGITGFNLLAKVEGERWGHSLFLEWTPKMRHE